MGKKKKGNDLLEGAVFAVLIALVILLVIAPYLIFFGWLYFSQKKKEYLAGLSHNPALFWLSDDEKDEFEECTNILNVVINEVDIAKKNAEAAGVTKNLDGTWNARSKVGKQTKATFTKNLPIIAENKDKFEYFAYLPVNMWEEFRKAYLYSDSLGVAFKAWLAAIIPSCFMFSDSFFSGLFLPFVAPFTFVLGFFTDSVQGPYGSDFKVLISCFVVALIAGGITYLSKGDEPSKVSPPPPEASMHNYRTYEFDVIQEFIAQDIITEISKEGLSHLIYIIAIFTISDGQSDKLEEFIINCIIQNHWNESWGDKHAFRDELILQVQQLSGSTVFSDIIKEQSSSLSKALNEKQLAAANSLVEKVIWIDDHLAEEELELYTVFHEVLEAAGMTVESTIINTSDDQEEGGESVTPNVPGETPKVQKSQQHIAQPKPSAPVTTASNATSDKYNVIFDGSILEGFELEEVKMKIANLLKITPDKAENLFSGKRFVLRRNATLQQGESALSKLKSIGAHSQLSKVEVCE